MCIITVRDRYRARPKQLVPEPCTATCGPINGAGTDGRPHCSRDRERVLQMHYSDPLLYFISHSSSSSYTQYEG